MKKVVYFLLALVLVALNACDNEPKFKVQGEVAGATDKNLTFYFIYTLFRRINTYLCTILDENYIITHFYD